MGENKEEICVYPSIAMEIDTQGTFLFYYCFPEPRTLLQNPSSSSPPSPAKISFQFTRQTFILILDEAEDFLRRIPEEADDLSMDRLCICVDAEDVVGDNSEFYLSVYESLRRIGIPDEGLHGLATSIAESAYRVKLLESSSNRSFRELLVKVNVMVVYIFTVSDPSTEIENAIRESMEEFEEANYGMVPTSEKAKKSMLKSITVSGKENLPVKECSDGHERKRTRRESTKEETCVICLEDIPVGSCATQVPCSHVFHRRCIEEWLEVSHNCPICRFEFPAD